MPTIIYRSIFKGCVVILINLAEDVFPLRSSTNRLKIVRTKKSIQKNLKDNNNVQLQDAVTLLNLYLEELEYCDFNYAAPIVSPILQRLAGTANFDFYDIHFVAQTVKFAKNYKTADSLATKALETLESYQNEESYLPIKLMICTNTMFRLLRAKYFDSQEVTAVFEKYLNLTLELCSQNNELLLEKTTAIIRKNIFYKEYEALDNGLEIILEKANVTLYKSIMEEVNAYNSFAKENMTKMQINMTVGVNIRKLRKSRFLSLENFAEMLGISTGFLQLIELGKRGASIHNLYKISQIFGMSIDELVNNKLENPHPETTEIKKLVSLARHLPKTSLKLLNQTARQLGKVNKKGK